MNTASGSPFRLWAETARELAAEAGKRALDHLARPIHVEYKELRRGYFSPVTQADKEIEAFVREEVRRRFPGHGILGEEGAEAPATAENPLWVVDPIDGTTNFLNRLPFFAVSIGVVQANVPVAGAIYLPGSLETGGGVYWAWRDGGAFLEDRPLVIATESELKPSSTVGVPGDFRFRYRFTGPLARYGGEYRVLGSIAAEMALTAAGVLRYALFGPPRLWDIAAGVVLVREAGGAVLVRERRRDWQPLERFEPPRGEGPELERLRRWTVGTVLIGSPDLAWLVARNLRPRSDVVRWLRTQLLRWRQRARAHDRHAGPDR